jgi:DHA1 family bicyclomycin/chloramphenicol resistance-like MFS transporter
MTVFIVVPVVAPSLGALIVSVADWRWVFGFCVAAALAVALWSLRLPETLRPEFRRDLRLASLAQGARAVLGNRQTLASTLAITALFGVFTSYLASSEIIVNDVFGMGELFPLVFGGLAVVLGAAMLANAHVVGRVGVGRLVRLVLPIYVAVAAVIVVMAIVSGGHPPFWAFAPVLALLLAGHSLLIPNLNTLAMDPMAAVAGTASAVIGTMSTAGGAAIGWLIDRSFNGTVIPISIGFLACGLIALGLVYWAELGRRIGSTEEVEPEPSLP